MDAEEQASFQEGYVNDSDPSVLRFLIASREEVSSVQASMRPLGFFRLFRVKAGVGAVRTLVGAVAGLGLGGCGVCRVQRS